MQNKDYTGLFFAANCALAVFNAGFAFWYATRGDPFCIISFVAYGISVYGAVDMLRYRKKRKHLIEEHERVMQQLDALRDYYEQMRDEQTGFSNHIKKRGRGRVAHLAETHRKARVRKKNKRRMRDGDS